MPARALALATALLAAGATPAAAAAKPKAKAGAAAPAAPAEKSASPRLDQLLAEWKRAPGLYARFREEKHLAMLDAPLLTEGTIHFAPPARLARRAESPIASVLLIDGDKLRYGDAEGGQSVDLATNPVARLFVDSFVKLLAGDREGLERLFRVTLAARAGGGWRMTLAPRVAPMDKVIKELVLDGDGLVVRTLDVRETSGDWTHTVFSDVDVARRYTPAELGRLFRLPGS
jgi:hypothetical protein